MWVYSQTTTLNASAAAAGYERPCFGGPEPLHGVTSWVSVTHQRRVCASHTRPHGHCILDWVGDLGGICDERGMSRPLFPVCGRRAHRGGRGGVSRPARELERASPRMRTAPFGSKQSASSFADGCRSRARRHRAISECRTGRIARAQAAGILVLPSMQAFANWRCRQVGTPLQL